jgi:protein-arginine kinase activator protein McsA
MDCRVCHLPANNPADTVHSKNFANHGVLKKEHAAACKNCHSKEETSCLNCHTSMKGFTEMQLKKAAR